jgi:hypothetical protein
LSTHIRRSNVTITRKTLCFVYGVIGLLALVGTWGNNLQYFRMGLGYIGFTVHYWEDTLVNSASRSVTADLLFFSLAATVWLLLESRRLGMRLPWLYVVLSLLIAASVMYPLFLINRERALSKLEAPPAGYSLRVYDVIGLIVLGIAFTAYIVITLTR